MKKAAIKTISIFVLLCIILTVSSCKRADADLDSLKISLEKNGFSVSSIEENGAYEESGAVEGLYIYGVYTDIESGESIHKGATVLAFESEYDAKNFCKDFKRERRSELALRADGLFENQIEQALAMMLIFMNFEDAFNNSEELFNRYHTLYDFVSDNVIKRNGEIVCYGNGQVISEMGI